MFRSWVKIYNLIVFLKEEGFCVLKKVQLAVIVTQILFFQQFDN